MSPRPGDQERGLLAQGFEALVGRALEGRRVDREPGEERAETLPLLRDHRPGLFLQLSS